MNTSLSYKNNKGGKIKYVFDLFISVTTSHQILRTFFSKFSEYGKFCMNKFPNAFCTRAVYVFINM